MIQVVIYLGSGPMTMVSSIDRKPKCQFQYDIINMQDVPAGVFLRSPRSAERALAVVSKSADPRRTIRKVLASWKGLPDKELRENFERLRTLSQLRNSEIMAKEEVERMPFELDFRESEIYKMGAREGRAEGARQGRAQGQLDAARDLLAKLLENRFGPLSRATRNKLKQADRELIDLWVSQFHTAHKVSDLIR